MSLQSLNNKMFRQKFKKFRLKLFFGAIILIVLFLICAQWVCLQKKKSTLNALKNQIEKVQIENEKLEHEISESGGVPAEKSPDRIFAILPK